MFRQFLTHLGNLFTPNEILDAEDLLGVRKFLKRWGVLLAAVAVVGMLWLGSRDANPEAGRWFDLVHKAFFSLCRAVLGAIGYLGGAWLGYFVFQAVESSSAGVHTMRPEGDGEPLSTTAGDLSVVHAEALANAFRLLNRGLLLALCVATGALVGGLVLGR